jgi:hypothetical protein
MPFSAVQPRQRREGGINVDLSPNKSVAGCVRILSRKAILSFVTLIVFWWAAPRSGSAAAREFTIGNSLISRVFQAENGQVSTVKLKARSETKVSSSEFALIVKMGGQEVLLNRFNTTPGGWVAPSSREATLICLMTAKLLF